MAINIHCRNCATDMRLSVQKCPNCKEPIPARGRTYRVVVRVHGKRTSQLVTNLDLAREIEAKLKKDNIRDEHDITEKIAAPNLNAVWQKFLPWAQEHKKSWKTDFYYYQKHLAPAFGDKTLDTIYPFDIEKLILKMKKGVNQHGNPYSKATIKHQLVLLSRLFSVADTWGLYNGPNPCRKIKKPTLNNMKNEFLSDDELSRLLEVLATWPDRMSAAFIKFAMFTGMRRGELFKLQWADIDMVRQTATLRDPKGNRDVVLPLSGKSIKILQEVPREYNTTFIFYGKNGNQRTNFKGPWLRIRQAAGLPDNFRLHGLRHHWASQLVSNGVPIFTVQKLLGHKDAKTTARYAHLADQALKAAVELSDELFKPKPPKVVNIKEIKNA